MSKPLRIWLTGSTGQLGTALLRLFPSGKTHTWLTTTRAEVDLNHFDVVTSYLADTQPDLIVNAAAYTAVDQAERERDMAHRLNAELPGLLGKSANCPLIHISTDYVFGGSDNERSGTPYRETEPPHPANWYGETKAEGEKRLLSTSSDSYILRTSWLYGPTTWGKSFYKSIRTNALAGKTLRIVDDEIGTPTSTLTLSRVIMSLISTYGTPQQVPYGIYHVSDLGECSRYRFAQAIVALDPKTKETPSSPCKQDDLGLPAHRPHYSALDSSKIARYFPQHFQPWEKALQEVYDLEYNR